MAKNGIQWVRVKFKMPKTYQHISMLYFGEELAAIIEAFPPCRIKSLYGAACKNNPPLVLDWMAETIDRIRYENCDL